MKQRKMRLMDRLHILFIKGFATYTVDDLKKKKSSYCLNPEYD